MTAPGAPSVRDAIEQLYAENWLRIDGRSDATVGALFADDGVLRYADLTWIGPGAIDGFYTPYRQSNHEKGRRTRHLSVNHHITPLAEQNFRVRGVVFVFSGIGSVLPLLSSAPSGVADFDDVCVLDGGGIARFRERATTMIFADAGSFDFSKVAR